jgi:hypothetical protein
MPFQNVTLSIHLYLQKKELSKSMQKKYLVLQWKPFAGDSNLELTENEFLG